MALNWCPIFEVENPQVNEEHNFDLAGECKSDFKGLLCAIQKD